MGRYTGPKDKLSRRFGVPLFGATKALEHKNYPPGMHGPKGGRRKQSDYSIALAEKQKLRFQYGLLERQFRRYFEAAATKRGVNVIRKGASRAPRLSMRTAISETGKGVEPALSTTSRAPKKPP